MTGFTVQVFSNEFLPPGAVDVHAVVTVTADGTRGASATGASPEAVEVLVIDTSGSMQVDGRIHEARRALAAAIAQIRDGVWFSVVSGTHVGQLVFPAPTMPGYHNGAVRADESTRAMATEAVRHVQANGGTAMSTWLDAAAGIVSGFPGAIHHVLFVTDGKNESEPAAALQTALHRYPGLFQVDCRGVGANWLVEELRAIAHAFLGTVDIIPEPAEMAEEFRAIMSSAMGKAVADMALRVWTPQHAELVFVKQVAPTIESLAARPGPNPLTVDFPTGAWGAEERDYHVAVRVKAAGVGEEMLAARVSLVVDGQAVSQGLVKAMWSEDEHLTARINPEVAHYTGQQELAEAIADGLAARQAGDESEATTKLGRAVQLAAAAGNDATTRLLAKVVDIEDTETGTVRLKKDAEAVDVMTLDTRSTKTTRVRPGGASNP